MTISAFCQRLASALAARQLTRNQLLHLGGSDFTYRKIQGYCSGGIAPPLEFLALLGRLGFDIHQLVTGSSADAASQLAAAQAVALVRQLASSLAQAQATLDELAPVLACAPMGEAGLSASEAQVLAAFRAASPQQQEMVLGMLVSNKTALRQGRGGG